MSNKKDCNTHEVLESNEKLEEDFEQEVSCEDQEKDSETSIENDKGIDSENATKEEGNVKSELSKMEELLAKERAKSEEYCNQMLRLQADFENYRKRVNREREDLLKYRGEQIIIELLPVLDSFDIALNTQSDDSDKLLEGIQMISKQLHEVLAREGVEIIATLGETFDPEIHEAVMKEESEEHPENTVMMELRRGYTYKGKVIRAAMVKVAG